MSRAHLARNASIPARYRLRTPPQTTSSLVVVARGRRLRLRLRDRGVHLAEPSAPSPETPTDPESSPTVRPSRTLRRTYTRMPPTEGHRSPTTRSLAESAGIAAEAPLPVVDSGSRAVATNSQGVDQFQFDELQEVVDPESPSLGLYDSDGLAETPITGIQIGTGLFRLVNPSDMPIQIFEAPMPFEEFIYLRLQLDLSDGGLTHSQFRVIVGECGGCERAMLMRSKDHHRCPGKNAPPTLVPAKELFSLLDSTAGGPGLTRNQFQRLFAECIVCDRMFTRDAASRHVHDLDADSDNDLSI